MVILTMKKRMVDDVIAVCYALHLMGLKYPELVYHCLLMEANRETSAGKCNK